MKKLAWELEKELRDAAIPVTAGLMIPIGTQVIWKSHMGMN